jgi:CheY-like chemotaxis protein
VNAIDALGSDDGEKNRIVVRAFTALDGWAVVEVEDDGVGIPADVLPHIFEPFFTTKAAGVGSGLGLAICRRIVEDAGGRIEARSTPGNGATFRVTLPPDAAPEAAGPVASGRMERRMRVLVVDDEPALARVIGMMIEEEHDVAIATSGAEVLARRAKGERFDAILCDIMMPEMSGIDVYEALEAAEPGAGRRVVFMTGGVFTERAQHFLARHANRCVDKPFARDALLAALSDAGRDAAE